MCHIGEQNSTRSGFVQQQHWPRRSETYRRRCQGTFNAVAIALAGEPEVLLFDEPTTGLHPADIRHLLNVLGRLVDSGNTVIIIEHNLDVIKTADHIIDLGPEGGEEGGQIIAAGSPEEIASHKDSYTGSFLTQGLE